MNPLTYAAMPWSLPTRKARTVTRGHIHSSSISTVSPTCTSISKAYMPEPRLCLLRLNCTSPVPFILAVSGDERVINCGGPVRLSFLTCFMLTFASTGVPSGRVTITGTFTTSPRRTSPSSAQSPLLLVYILILSARGSILSSVNLPLAKVRFSGLSLTEP